MAEEGVSILETESYVLAVVFLVFLAVFTVAEKVRVTVPLRFCLLRLKLQRHCLQLLEWRQANLTRRRKVGLLVCTRAPEHS